MIELLTLNWMAFTASLALLLILLFILKFEFNANSKSIALLGMLTALTVVLRQLMHSFGEFSPVYFIVIIVGCVYGCFNGFILGAATIFVSNFLLGHGPWTPYQMIGLGLVGFIAGLIPVGRKMSFPFLLAYSVFSAYLYGLITDLFWWSAFAAEHTINTYIAVAASGILMDSSRALGNFLFMLFFCTPLLKILLRFRKRFYIKTQHNN
jgi:energy-coupling factor transport system substrate-specific component